jgi:hypothetical protein
MLNSPALKSAVATVSTANSQIPNTRPTTSSSFDEATQVAHAHGQRAKKMTKDDCLSLFADVNFKFDQFNQSKKGHLDALKEIANRLIELNNMVFRGDDPRFRLNQKEIEELQSLGKQYEENLGQIERGMDEIAQGAGNLNDCRSHLTPTQNQRLNDIQGKLREAGHEIKTVNDPLMNVLRNIGQGIKAILNYALSHPGGIPVKELAELALVIGGLLVKMGVFKSSQNVPENSSPSPYQAFSFSPQDTKETSKKLLASNNVRFAS